MFASDYPLLAVFWTMVWFFLWMAWLVMLFRVIGDVFRNRNVGGLAKGLWLLVVVVVPFLGVFVYVIVHGGEMAQRQIDEGRADDQAFRNYVRDAAGTSTTASELQELIDLRDRGVITDAEFSQQKAKVLS